MKDRLIVDAQWLSGHLKDPGVVVADVRQPFFHAQSHIPGAINVPLMLLSGRTVGPPAAQPLAETLGSLGVGRDSHVVAYDDGASPAAAQFIWILRYHGHAAASMLDGGITNWAHEGLPTESGTVQRPAVTYEIGERDETLLADIQLVRESIGAPDAVIVDTRTAGEYLGQQFTARRNGHIPTAINIDWSNNLTATDGEIMRLQSDESLRRLYETAGVTPDKKVIVHCQTGSRSAETLVVLKHLGYPLVANYAGGWQEWGNREDTPVEEA